MCVVDGVVDGVYGAGVVEVVVRVVVI